MQKQRIASSGWWKHLPPGGGLGGSGRPGGAPFGLIAFAALAVIWFGSAVTAFFGVFSSWPAALLLGLLFPSIVAYFVYRVLLPARSAQGSALTLRTESFRRFLHASESRHVEWAWEHGLLREYSGWAVALGEADAWSDALARSNVPAPARRLGGTGAARHESGLDPVVAHGSATEEQRWLEWWLRRIERRFRRWWRRGRQPRFLVSGYRPSPGRRCIASPAWRQRVILVIDDRDEPTQQVDAEAAMTARLRGRSLEVLISELSAPLRSTRSAVEQRA